MVAVIEGFNYIADRGAVDLLPNVSKQILPLDLGFAKLANQTCDYNTVL